MRESPDGGLIAQPRLSATELAMGTGSYGHLQVVYLAQNVDILLNEQGEDGAWLHARRLP
jgi:hypothetical protein